MTLSFLIATIGGLILAFSNTHEITLFGLFLTRLGIDCSYCLIYVLTMEKFPSSIQARLFGIFTLSASVSTILSPMIAEMDDPIPLFLYIVICFFSIISSMTLDKIQEQHQRDDLSDEYFELEIKETECLSDKKDN